MRALIVFESMYGNTRLVAEAWGAMLVERSTPEPRHPSNNTGSIQTGS
ncbi:MAG: hypothetical protein LH475_13125 [Cryobacterium sp.]|nr:MULTISPECIES: flavodoxin family protein [unclassified Cryobacterium]MCY7405542.1 hypothetical protein [Cryobacterium sp.]MEC5154474.1 flavodoxin [Cryobacterium sp. CAN_C3]